MSDDCVSIDFNEELVERIRPVLYYSTMVLILCSILLDINIYKWRANADWIILFEFIFTLIIYSIPSNQSNYHEYYFFSMTVNAFIFMYTDSRWQVISLTFAHISITYVMMSTVYKKQLTPQIVFVKALLICFGFFINSLLAMVLSYIKSLHSKLNVSNI